MSRGAQRNAYLHVMREGMATASMDECGIYIGTTTGQIYRLFASAKRSAADPAWSVTFSRDNGDGWELMLDYLPPVNSVDCGVVV